MRTPSCRFLGLVAGAALVLSSCSSISDTRAVSVNGDVISAEDVESELQAIRGNDSYREVVEQGLAGQGLDMTLSGEGAGSFDTAFVARLLTLSVYFELLAQEAAERDESLTEIDLEENRPQAVASVGGDAVFDAFPVSYQDELIRRQALTRQVQELIVPSPTTEELRALYEANQAELVSVCVSHIFANTQERGEEEARARIDDLARQLDEGGDFRVLASEQSDDPAAAAEAGSLGCGARGRFIPDFEAAAFSLPVGEVSDPVQTEAGFHLILVESREPQTFEEVQAQLAEPLEEQRLAEFTTFIDDLTCQADIEVNPRYGSWTGACETPEVPGEVLPPDGPVTTLPAPGDPGRLGTPGAGG